MENTMEIDPTMYTPYPDTQEGFRNDQNTDSEDAFVPAIELSSQMPLPRDTFREIQVKVHIRKPERDSWIYLGRGLVTQEMNGHSSRVVIRAMSTGKVMISFGEASDLQAEKRGNFIVIGCVEGSHVVSWSLNALNNSDTLRLLASIELACYKCNRAPAEPRLQNKVRRRIERVIKDDRRRRHRRRKEQEAMVDAFAKQTLTNEAANAEQGVPVA
ncbi:hypothetical protein M378DRAFT_20368 [Amanita muscaria Koide BX008]|uniref:Uncharacterized protein n=1 Tax=Amanita muscaria (strain Koide BX008) TaxID=946122 RepID=A0A0C2X961_AMAMK|nr:hypothetical protein M378DRAFT_20368 [Amanita muscaria Koide BX008]